MSTVSHPRKNILILGFTLFVVMLGFGVIIPIMPFYIDSLGAGGTELGLLMASYAVMRLVCGPIWGSVSDRIGRKPVLMIGVLGYGITMVLFGFATELWMLFVIRCLSGILSSATSPTTLAYISDSTEEKDRGGGMGMLGAALGLGTILGPGLGGLLGGASPGGALSIPFFVAGGMSFLAMLLIALFLPESLPAASRTSLSKDGLRQARLGIISLNDFRQALNSPIGILLVMTLLASFALTSFAGIFGLFASEQYGYGPEQVGGLFVVFGIGSALAQAVLSGPLTRGWGEKAVISGSLVAAAAGFIAMALAHTDPLVLASIGFFSLSVALLTPAVSALISKQTRLEQGLTMGMNSSFESLGRIMGPLAGGFLFDRNAILPYLSGALVMLAGFFLSLRTTSRVPRPSSGEMVSMAITPQIQGEDARHSENIEIKQG